jgi:hypothetical protein
MQIRIGISHAMIATLIVAAYPGAGASPVATPKSLMLQETRTATVEANQPYNFTRIRIEAGRSYQFTVASPAWNDGARFLIGLGRSWVATQSGYLVAYANDCMPCYENHSRVITLTVKRTQ